MILMQNMFLAKKIGGSKYFTQDKNSDKKLTDNFWKTTLTTIDQMDPILENGSYIIAVELYQNDRALIFPILSLISKIILMLVDTAIKSKDLNWKCDRAIG